MKFLKFQPRDTPNLKGWSTSAKDMPQKRWKERHIKSEILSTSKLYSEIMLGTSIVPPSDWKHKCSTNSPPADTWQPPRKTIMYSTTTD